MNTEKIKADIYMDLLKRGHTPEGIEKMTPDEAFDEWCNWHGLIQWGPVLREGLDNLRAASA